MTFRGDDNDISKVMDIKVSCIFQDWRLFSITNIDVLQ